MARKSALSFVFFMVFLPGSHLAAQPPNNNLKPYMTAMRLFKPIRSDPPEFSLPDLQGKLMSLQAVRGKIVLLNFWATWCPPCRKEMPSMQRLYEKLRNDGFEILAISIDVQGAKIVEPFMKKYRLTFPALLDSNGNVSAAYRVRGIPTSFIVDDQGRLVAGGGGARDWSSPDAVALLKMLLAARPPAPSLVTKPCPPRKVELC